MTDPIEFSEAVRSFMDHFVDRSMQAWKHFARDAGMSMPQLSILMQLHTRGSCSISEIGERFQTTSAAASQLIDRLVQAGYLERAEDPADRRSKLLTLTPGGQELVETLRRKRYSWVDELASHLSHAEQEKVLEGLALITHAAGEFEPVIP